MASAIAGGVASNLIAKVLELVGKEAVRKAASWWGARDDLDKLSNTMRMIQARVRDADSRQEGENSDLIKLWLQRLKLVLLRADDLFDEVLTLDQQKQMEKRVLGKVGILFSKSGPLRYNRKLANEIKSIRKEVDAIKSDMADLHLVDFLPQELPMARLLESRETTSILKKDVTGRNNDRNNIIKMLLDPKEDGEPVTFIPIVGFGGLGKTTLAQLVFNDEGVRPHFDLTGWAYVPEKDDLIAIKRKIFHAFTIKQNYQDLSLQYIEQGIIDSIANKKYLLVLDDLWTEESDNIIELLNLLKGGKHGSKVIVTTRLDAVAMYFGPIEAAYKLGTLTDDESWNMFKGLAFRAGQESNNPDLSLIGQDIVKMCGNVPLAIEVVGGSLLSKHTQSQWSRVKDDLSRAQLAEGGKIMAVLKLSYHYLPPESKTCFAYCSLFPKGYEFEKEDLVHLWLAQQYIELDKGERYFLDLVARNLFQVSERNSNKIYKMHDLLHDLAQKVAGDDTMVLVYDDYHPCQSTHDQLLHINLNTVRSPPPSFKNANRLWSLLNFDSHQHPVKLLLECQSLRVLSMTYSDYDSKKLINFIGRLTHLRYLKIRGGIRYLPDSLTRLVNLQTLNLQSCNYLKILPRDIAKLVNLRHLLLPDHDQLTGLPSGFEKLISLQELNWFKVGKNNGIDSLGVCSYRGEIRIEFCRWRRYGIEEGKRSNLKNNHQLTCLTLDLGFMEEKSCDAADNSGMHDELLRFLQLPPNLKDLSVVLYKGNEMPVRWLEGLSQLVSIQISRCRECKVLPKLIELPHLKSLKLYELYKLEYVEDEDEDEQTTHNRCFFPSLKVLELRDCGKLKGWRRASKDDGERCPLLFSCLLEMTVIECPMLMSTHLAPKLESLWVSNINWKMFEGNVRSNDDDDDGEAASSSSAPPPSSSALFTSLKKLEICCVKLISLSITSSMCNLSILRIKICSELRNLRFESPNSIRKLVIYNCGRLSGIREMQHLSRLVELEIIDCEELEMEEEEEQEEGKSSRDYNCYPYLQKLVIGGCPKVKSFPPSLKQALASLQTLEIISAGCPELAEKNMPGGEDWHLIQRIPNIHIRKEFYSRNSLFSRSNGKDDVV